VIGAAGRMGQRRVRAVAATGGLALRWVVDSCGPVVEALASRHGCRWSRVWEDVLEDHGVDVVMVCTPNATHAEIAVQAMEAGKHVLVEKPLASSLIEAERMVEAARLTGKTLKTGFNYPFLAPIREVFRLLNEGAIGAVHTVRAQAGHSQFLCEPESWFCDPEQAGGGVLLDLGVHLADLGRRILGPFSLAVGMSTRGQAIRTGVEETGAALFRTTAGKIMTLHASWVECRPFLGVSLELLGLEGSLVMDLAGKSVHLRKRHGGACVEEHTRTFPGDNFDASWVDELVELRDAIREGRRVDGDGEDGVEALRMIFAVYESDRFGGLPVRIGLRDETHNVLDAVPV
jgi:predicted dehydrogenase